MFLNFLKVGFNVVFETISLNFFVLLIFIELKSFYLAL